MGGLVGLGGCRLLEATLMRRLHQAPPAQFTCWKQRRTHDDRLLHQYQQLSYETPMVELNSGRSKGVPGKKVKKS